MEDIDFNQDLAEKDAKEMEAYCADINNEGLVEAERQQQDGIPTEDIPTIFNIPSYNMPYVDQKIEKVNKRAAKLGAEPVRVVELGKTEKFIYYTESGINSEGKAYKPGDVAKVITMHKIQIVGKAPALNGWTLISVVEPVDGKTLMRKFPGNNIEIPVEFRDVTPDRCDHCHTVRRRNETFIVHHEKGEWKVVGRQCLFDFTGIKNPERIADYASFLRNLMADIGSVGEERMPGCWGRDGEYIAPMQSFLYDVAIYTMRKGFVSSKAAYESRDTDNPKQATGKGVFNDLYYPVYGDGEYEKRVRNERRKYREEITDEEDTKATMMVDNALQFGKTQFVEAEDNRLTDYGHNMKVLLALDYVRSKDVGFVASVISGYLRSIEQKIDYSKSQHVGTVGGKIIVPVTILKTKAWEGQYGAMNIVTMQDDDGNILTLFAKQTQVLPEEGKYITMAAKVKRHDIRGNQKSTIVNYAKFM